MWNAADITDLLAQSWAASWFPIRLLPLLFLQFSLILYSWITENNITRIWWRSWCRCCNNFTMHRYRCRSTPVIHSHIHSSCWATHRWGDGPKWHHGVKHNWTRRWLCGFNCRALSTFTPRVITLPTLRTILYPWITFWICTASFRRTPTSTLTLWRTFIGGRSWRFRRWFITFSCNYIQTT